jgi:acetyl-CoA acyltransferase
MYIERYGEDFPNQGIGAEQIADRWGLSRQQLDEFSLGSHEKAAAAIDEGRFKNQIVPVTNPDGVVIDTDEGVRRGGTLEKLGALKTAFKEDGKITAANSSQISDGSAALLITTSEFAAAHGLTPLARIHTAVLAAAEPMPMLHAPIPATQKALAKSGLKIDEIGAFEVNEAFASVPLAWLKDIGADEKALNPNGGAIALGHPLGGSGARLMTTLVHHMRDNGIRYGLQTMCEGGASGPVRRERVPPCGREHLGRSAADAGATPADASRGQRGDHRGRRAAAAHHGRGLHRRPHQRRRQRRAGPE